MTYLEQLQSPQWQRRRLTMLEHAGWMCQRCLADDAQLHVHHKRYHKGRKAWEYDDDELLVVCRDCHTSEHEMLDQFHWLMRSDVITMRDVVALIRGYLDGLSLIGGTVRSNDNESRELTECEAYVRGTLAGSVALLSTVEIDAMMIDAMKRGRQSIIDSIAHERGDAPLKPFDARQAVQ